MWKLWFSLQFKIKHILKETLIQTLLYLFMEFNILLYRMCYTHTHIVFILMAALTHIWFNPLLSSPISNSTKPVLKMSDKKNKTVIFKFPKLRMFHFYIFFFLLCWYTCPLYMLTISGISDCQFVFLRD